MEVNVAYACNDAYIIHTGISMISLLENNKDIEVINIYFIDMGVSHQSLLDLQSIADQYERNLIVVPFSQWEPDLPVSSTGRHIKSVYAKIFFGRITDADRILYIDSDTVVVSSIKELWQTEMGECAIGGVQTINTPLERSKIGLSKDALVMNDGIALMDLRSWRENKFEKKCIDFIHQWDGNPPVLSEGTINAVCQGYIHKLKLRYNLTSHGVDFKSKEIELLTETSYYTQAEINESVKHPCIIHYVSGFHKRPWCKGSTHPFRNEYIKYKQMSKWSDAPLIDGKVSRKVKVIAFLHKILPMRFYVFLFKKLGKSN